MMGPLKRFTNLLAHVSTDPLTGPHGKPNDRKPVRRTRDQHAPPKPESDCRR